MMKCPRCNLTRAAVVTPEGKDCLGFFGDFWVGGVLLPIR